MVFDNNKIYLIQNNIFIVMIGILSILCFYNLATDFSNDLIMINIITIMLVVINLLIVYLGIEKLIIKENFVQKLLSGNKKNFYLKFMN